MKFLRIPVNLLLRLITGVICRVRADELKKVPAGGPLILIANHINFLEVPLLISRLDPRPVTGLAKDTSWKNPLFWFLFNVWEGIPIQRGEPDAAAFRKVQDVLAQNKILAMSPEGTRSHDGQLQKGYPGVVLLAVRSGAPIQPVAYYGSENFWQNFKRLKRTDFIIRVGNPFRVDLNGASMSREVRQQAADEIMCQLAAVLPPAYRGIYADLDRATEEYVRFEPGVESNLKHPWQP